MGSPDPRRLAALASFDWRKCLYEDHCPLDHLCEQHLAKHRSACEWPAHECGVCEVQPNG